MWIYAMVRSKNVKASYPLEITEYVVANKINEKQAFKSWFKDVLRAQDRTILRVERRGAYTNAMVQGGSNKKYWRTTIKFGIGVQKYYRTRWRSIIKQGLTYGRRLLGRI